MPDLERLQLLNAQLAYAAAHSPYYRETLRSDAPLTSLAELARLPFLTPEILRAQGNRLVCVPASAVARIVSLQTSGSTGEAKRLSFTRGDLERTVAYFAEGMSWLAAPGDKVAVLMPCAAPDGIGDLLCRGLLRAGMTPLPIGVRPDLYALSRELLDSQPAVLVGFPWQLRALALLCPELRPRTLVLSADYIPAPLQDMLRGIWHCAPIAHFGMTETGYGCAEEHPCEPGHMYLRRDELIAEIVAPQGVAVLPPGMPGELVLTTLRREATPLIRYRTGDRAAMDAAGRITRIFGRIDVPPSFYELQDTLCAKSWLYDYEMHGGTLSALLSEDAPPDCAEILAAAADVPAAIRRVPPEEAILLRQGKRL